MADNESEPPGWPFNEAPPPIPPPPEPAAYEPPAATPNYPPPAPAGHQPPPPAATPNYPPPAPAAHQPPPPAPAAPYQQVGPPGYQSPGQPPPPVAWPQTPQTSSKKSVFITVAVIIGIVIVGIASCTVWFVGTVKAPVDEANRFLALVDSGDYQAAAALAPRGCDGSDINADVLNEFFGRRPISYDLKSSSITNNNATVSGSFSSTNRPESGIEVYLRDRDGWVVCGFRFTG